VAGFVGFGRVTTPKLGIRFVAHSPIGLIVTDPEGFTITPDTRITTSEELLREIPGVLYYSESDIDDDGRLGANVSAPTLKIGSYLIQVTPKLDALPTDTYNLDVEAAGKTITLAQNVPIRDIPPQGYEIESTGDGICPAQAPTIVCPPNQIAMATTACPVAAGAVVTYPAPMASDNCALQSVICNPPSGSTFPVGTSTVICTATDSSSNTATCSFAVTVFSLCLQDETNTGNFVLINALTGDYSFYCNGVPVASGRGTLNVRGCIGSIDHNKGDRRVHIQWDTTAASGKGAGTAIIQLGPNNTVCQITDKDMSNNSCSTQPQTR
jgi:hypothetical protein